MLKMIYTNEAIKKILPHRYPFLLVDTIEEMTETQIIGKKNVTANEPFFQGHFPDKQVMPGVLIIEALAQTGAVLLLSLPDYQGGIAYLTGVNKIRIKQQVIPGDTLTLHVELIKMKLSMGFAAVTAKKGDEVVLTGELMFYAEAKNDK